MTERNVLTINGRFLTQQITGVQRYAREITAELDKLLQEDRWKSSLSAEIVVPASSKCVPAFRTITCKQTRGSGPLWDQFVLPYATRGVLLSLCNSGPITVAKHIVCIHDLNVFLTPGSYSLSFRSYYRTLLPLLARRAGHVVTVSDFSARMITAFGLCGPEKITVIRGGYDHVRRWRPEVSRYVGWEGRRPFIFVLGSRARHKNLQILFEIAQEIDTLGLDILVAGQPGRPFSAVAVQSASPNVRMLGFVTDDDLAALYERAFCFVFPSLTEGFGLPALEAMAFGCPVIASSAASLPEVCGDAALYADPGSPHDWLTQIIHLQKEPGVAQMLRTKGPRQAQQFSWAKSAELYVRLALSLQSTESQVPAKLGPECN